MDAMNRVDRNTFPSFFRSDWNAFPPALAIQTSQIPTD